MASGNLNRRELFCHKLSDDQHEAHVESDVISTWAVGSKE